MPEVLGIDAHNNSTVVHCWTTRECVRLAAAAANSRLRRPCLIHLEDNEEFVTRSHLGLTISEANRLSSRDWDDRIPSALSHPYRAKEFISGAAGVTIIIDALRTAVPENKPVHRIDPGVDTDVFTPGNDPNEREKLCREFGVPLDTRIIVYTGNSHSCNAEEILTLYKAVNILNSRGIKIHLIRTGTDHAATDEFRKLPKQYITHLGWVDRWRLPPILRLADVFVQPGKTDEFNKYRLPSKLPEFLATGRPLILPATNLGLRLRDGIDAVLLKHGDALEIAQRVADILSDPDLAMRLARNGRLFAVENFIWERSALALEAFYDTTLASWRPKPNSC